MTEPEWHIRQGNPGDRELLRSFACANSSATWQCEVERYIQVQLIDWAFDPHAAEADPRLLLGFSTSGELFGVAAHEKVRLREGNGAVVHATKIEVVALAPKWQGRSFSEGSRISDVLMSALLADISARIPPRNARVYAIVHEDNHRSIALCRRHGLTEEMTRPDASYRRLVTPRAQSS